MDVVSYTDPWHGKRGDFAGCCGDFHRFIDWLETDIRRHMVVS